MKSVHCIAGFEKFVIYQPQSVGYRTNKKDDTHCEECAPLKIKLYNHNGDDDVFECMDRDKSSANDDLLNNFDSVCKLENPNWKPLYVRIYPDCIEIEFVDVRSYDDEVDYYSSEVITISRCNILLKVFIPQAMGAASDEYEIYYRDRSCRDCDIHICEVRHGCVFYEWRIKRHPDGKNYVHYEIND